MFKFQETIMQTVYYQTITKKRCYYRVNIVSLHSMTMNILIIYRRM